LHIGISEISAFDANLITRVVTKTTLKNGPGNVYDRLYTKQACKKFQNGDFS
jgi:hypothetical protein